MMDKTDNPGRGTAKAKPATPKEARLKAALKANMARRKDQARARADASGVDGADNNKNE
jgi:hypothetical protein